MDVVTPNKLEMVKGMSVVNNYELASEILKSDAFNVVNIVDYLEKLQLHSGMSFAGLINFTYHSPFFIEGDRHTELKKIFSNALGNASINFWHSHFEREVSILTKEFEFSCDTDLMNYCFDIAKKLIRPIIFGTATGLPDDFEARLYSFQKIAEPLLPLRQLVKLENELNYLTSCIAACLEHSASYPTNSLLHYLNCQYKTELSPDDIIMLLFIVYGAKTPLIQTLGNIFLELLTVKREHYFSEGSFNHDYFISQIDELIHSSASLLHIHRVAIKHFKWRDFEVSPGDLVLIQTGSSNISDCSHHRSLSFGSKAHYCSGALMSKSIISMVVPAFFKQYPNVTVQNWENDLTIHTAKALVKLRVNIK